MRNKRKPPRKAVKKHYAEKNNRQLTSSQVGIKAKIGLLPSIEFSYNRTYKHNRPNFKNQ